MMLGTALSFKLTLRPCTSRMMRSKLVTKFKRSDGTRCDEESELFGENAVLPQQFR